MQKILVSGSNGFLGQHLKNSLSKTYQVFGVSRTPTDSSTYTWNEIEKIPRDIDALILCHAVVSNSHQNFGMQSCFDVNVALTEKLINQFSDVPQKIYISTASIFDPRTLITEHSSFAPPNNYAISKYWGGIIALQHQSKILCLPSVFGEGMNENTFIPLVIKEALTQKIIPVFGDGSRTQNYISVQNVLKYIESMLHLSDSKENYFIACDSREYSNSEVAEIIARVTGAKIIHTGKDSSPSVHYNNQLSKNELKLKLNCNFEEDLQNYCLWMEKKYW